MIDETLVSTVRDRLKKLLPYRRQVRPAIPASFPSFVDGELLRIDTATRDIVGGLKALDPILEALKGEQGGGGAPFPEAPIDGTPYARQDAGWTPVATIKGEPGDPGQPGEPGEPGRDGEDGADFPDAPLDGQLYARKDGAWETFEAGSGGSSGGASRMMASARIDCRDPQKPKIAAGFNVASVTKTATGLYRIAFATPIDVSKAGVSTAGQWTNVFSSRAIVQIGVERANGAGLSGTAIDISTLYSGNPLDCDDWFSVEVYDASALSTVVPAEPLNPDFAAVVFEAADAAGNVAPIRVLASRNVKEVKRLSAGRYAITFINPPAAVDSLVPSFSAWFAPYSNTSSVTMAIDRNTDQLGGMGLTSAGCIITAMGTTGYDPRRVAARFTAIT